MLGGNKVTLSIKIDSVKSSVLRASEKCAFQRRENVVSGERPAGFATGACARTTVPLYEGVPFKKVVRPPHFPATNTERDLLRTPLNPSRDPVREAQADLAHLRESDVNVEVTKCAA